MRPLVLVCTVSLLAAPVWAQDEAAPLETAAEAPPDAKQRVLVLDLQRGNVEEHIAQALTRVIVDALSQRSELQVFAAEDLRNIVELEAEKQALGCDTSSCLAEIAGAMGARFVVFGGITRVEETLVMSLSLFDSDEARPVNRETFSHGSAQRHLEQAPVVVDELLAPLGFEPIAEAPASEEAAGSGGGPSPALLWTGVGVGVGAGALAAVAGGLAGYSTVVLSDETAGKSDKNFALRWGAPALFGAVVLGVAALGGAGLAGAAFLVGE